jgi:hypothetical protein
MRDSRCHCLEYSNDAIPSFSDKASASFVERRSDDDRLLPRSLSLYGEQVLLEALPFL